GGNITLATGHGAGQSGAGGNFSFTAGNGSTNGLPGGSGGGFSWTAGTGGGLNGFGGTGGPGGGFSWTAGNGGTVTGVGGPGGGFSWTSGSTGGPSGSAAAGSFVWTVGSDTPPGNFQFLNGNVGIGTTNPAQKLDVAGNIKASGSVSGASFTGDGSALTLNASNLTTGTVTSGRLPAAGGDLSGTLTAATVAA